MNDYMTLEEFKMLFPELNPAGDNVIDFFLLAAQPYVNKSVWRDTTKMGHGYKAAAMLADSPYARTIRQDGAEVNYKLQFDEMLRTIAPRAAVLNA